MLDVRLFDSLCRQNAEMAARNYQMLNRNKADFYYLDKARIDAGFFISEACEKLGINRRTWERWKVKNECPVWAVTLLEMASGKLDFLGWKNWKLEQGVLYRADLNPKYYNWKTEDLMVSVFCDCPAHQRIRARMRPADALRLSSGNSDHETGLTPVLLVAESQSHPVEKQIFRQV